MERDRCLAHGHHQGGPLGRESQGELQHHDIKLALRQTGHCGIQTQAVFQFGNLRAELVAEAVQDRVAGRANGAFEPPASPKRPHPGPWASSSPPTRSFNSRQAKASGAPRSENWEMQHSKSIAVTFEEDQLRGPAP
ncbi:hypothetical protein [Streptomyces sp. NPDC004675]|uniref:hypothetical protein n=1 Tax=Streptomyces sp. NPDC004675 TaxID=3154286 RepID=UPI0033ABC3BE